MRTILTELWPIEDHAPYSMGVYIGVEGESHVAGLTEDESVLLQDIDVQAVVRAHKVVLNGREIWFGEFQGDIEERPAIQEATKGHA